MRALPLLVVLTLAAPGPVRAGQAPAVQSEDLGPGVSSYQRFLVFPHLQKGLESLRQGDRDRAIAELERAHAIAPQSTPVVLHLVAAYCQFGLTGRAEALVVAQLRSAPGDPGLTNAMAAIRTRLTPPAMPAAPPPATAGLRASSPRPTAQARRADQTAPQLVVHPARPGIGVATATLATSARERFGEALAARAFDEATRDARQWLATDGDAAGLDEVTYRLLEAGARSHAERLLLDRYPFAGCGDDLRETLLARLALLLGSDVAIPAQDLNALRAPLETARLRSVQGAIWARRSDCDAVEAALGARPAESEHDDWMRLGDCRARTAPALALEAYRQAHLRRPGGPGSRALGYQAFAVGQYRLALDAWRTVPGSTLSPDDLMAAATTALAAGEVAQAGSWIDAYTSRGESPNYRYWSVSASYREAQGDKPGTAAALEQAVRLEPHSDDLLRLSRLARDAEGRARWLIEAARLDGATSAVHLELAYALERTGRERDALAALERATALDPENRAAQLELGFAYWRAGRLEAAQVTLDRVWRVDHHDLAAGEQLVYIAQRLRQNGSARNYAREVLDALRAADDVRAGTADGQKVFGLQRLHEDLGRRLTLSVDGWSGTRVGPGTTSAQSDSPHRSYSQVEADYRLGAQAIRDGTTLSVYARVLADGGDTRSAVPAHNQTLGVGLRWKPLRDRVLYVAAEQQVPADGAGSPDLLVRASASLFNGGQFSDDWHAHGSGWFGQNLYLDAARYLRSGYDATTADYRGGYHLKVASRQTLEAYGHGQVSASGVGTVRRDVRGGAGVRWNIWHGGTLYNADPHKFSLGLEYQQVLETFLPDRNGVIFSVGSRW